MKPGCADGGHSTTDETAQVKTEIVRLEYRFAALRFESKLSENGTRCNGLVAKTSFASVCDGDCTYNGTLDILDKAEANQDMLASQLVVRVRANGNEKASILNLDRERG
jgi:hypothetical protein